MTNREGVGGGVVVVVMGSKQKHETGGSSKKNEVSFFRCKFKFRFNKLGWCVPYVRG